MAFTIDDAEILASNHSISRDAGFLDGNTHRGKMLIRYACKDMGLNCTFLIKGESLEDVVLKALAHVKENHAKDFNSLHTPAEVEQMKQSLARSTRIISA